jgi:phosphate transport system permease protein
VARHAIVSGGILVVLAVGAILVFVAREAAPLFRPPRVAPVDVAPVADAGGPLLAAWIDDDAAIVARVRPREIVFASTRDGAVLSRVPVALADSAPLSSARLEPVSGLVALGSSTGRAALAQIEFTAGWSDSRRTTTPRVRLLGEAVLDSLGGEIEKIAGDRDEDGQIALAGIAAGGRARYVLLDAEGSPAASAALEHDLPDHVPTSLVLSLHGEVLAVGTSDGTLSLWQLADPAAPQAEDHVRTGNAAVTALGILLGDQTLVVGTAAGDVSTWLRVRYVEAQNSGQRTVEIGGLPLAPGESRLVLDRDDARRLAHVEGLRFLTSGRPWTLVHNFAPHPAPIAVVGASPRGRSFATQDERGGLRVHHATTRRTRQEIEGPGIAPDALAFGPRGGALVMAAHDGALYAWSLDDPHPEASLGTLFGRTWYEGYVEPRHVWQSTGGTDEFEPKLGLVPLLVGTLKGTLYALLFSVPIAVLAALYVSQLAPAALRGVVKPLIELMAAMPSVVVGFLAALWLAPWIERNLGPALGALLAIPVGLAVAVGAWYALPAPVRRRSRAGLELAFLIPFLLAAAWIGLRLGAPLEAGLFGGDLQQWLFDARGITYDQRNCIVVGIALGFAVIPVIFTISEDAMSAVPRSLASGALALGASRWQTALHVILPAASPGIFAAIMLGFGRAVGETMIVLMATGNTPILDLSPFNGMRTMSAGIAVEIPEAPHSGTLYRVLFLTGFLLFTFTFVLNTAADQVGRRLRKRYGQF